ncbi:MAG: TRAP transporter large permease subunit, partial [Planctomycetales bacterium]|nr:TRAP transporter large permease subunit [Planctomycetales bacterium]MCA9225233.1 TRAP transporter large permease subunit [Planctomycetales bacterium]
MRSKTAAYLPKTSATFEEPAAVFDQIRKHVVTVLGVALCFFTLIEVNYNLLQPQSALAVFVGLGLVLCYLVYPLSPKLKNVVALRAVDVVLAVLVVICCGYVVVQTEPLFEGWWALGQSLGNRAGIETTTDFVIGVIGLLLVLEATRRSIGWIVPILAVLFMAHSYYCYLSNQNDWPILPDNMFPHAGQSAKDIVSTTYIQSLGVFGVAASVMFSYVFLFVVFGSFLEMSGATQFIIDFATKVFGRFRGGPAMVSVLASGLMGSLSGSAVANAVTTGSFTIPMMRAARFPRHVAGGITAAAASGGALVPPVMGAGAYMMLELIELKGGFLDIMKAAAIPAALFYISILVIVFLYSRRLGTGAVDAQDFNQRS